MKKHFQFPCFGWTSKVCIVFIVLTSTTSLACFGGGGGGGGKPDEPENISNHNENSTMSFTDIDEPLFVNLTGIKDSMERNLKTAWLGWNPSEETKKEWEEWYQNWQAENEKIGEGPWNYKKDKKGKGSPEGNGSDVTGWQDFTDERGPGSGWPDKPGWEDLGVGNGGSPVPPWAYTPKNIGKPTSCYLPPVKGTCKGNETEKPGKRYGYNPYTDECQEYIWSGCGGTRNRFIMKEKCEKHCMLPTSPTCSGDSGILAKFSRPII